jgi:hypothetical protein
MTTKQIFKCGKAAVEAIAGALAFAKAFISIASSLPAMIVNTAKAALAKWGPTDFVWQLRLTFLEV